MPAARPIMAEFDATPPVLAAIARLRAQGVADIDVFTPFPVTAIEEALAIPRSRIPLLAFAAAMLAGAGAYLLQWWMNAYDYPLNVGGRPPHMPPAFVPVTFEMAILACALTAFFAVMVRAGLPRLWDPVFEIDGFERVSVDRFWIAVEVGPAALGDDIARTLREAGALRVVGYE
jgi:hypothetical protein